MSSIEWLIKEIEKHDKQFSSFYGAEIEQAKEIHKQEIIDSWNSGIDNCGEFDVPRIANGKQYYQETFKKD